MLACVGRVPDNSNNSLGKQASRYLSVLLLANFSSGGREEGEKSPLSQELLSSKQGRMNSLLESSRIFLNPHLQRVLSLLLSIPTSSAHPFKGALAACSEDIPPRKGWRHPCLPQPLYRSGSGWRERLLRSSGCCKLVP